MIRSLRQDIFNDRPTPSSAETHGETASDKSGTVVMMIAREAEAVGKFCRRLHFKSSRAGGDATQRVELHAVYGTGSRVTCVGYDAPATLYRSNNPALFK